MDKYEYKVRADEIKELISRGEYARAAEIADTIDWRRVKSVMMLCTISDLYKINRRYEDARDMLLLAYERRPGGRTICYSLCELCIKTEDFVLAVEYYKEFVQAAPKDPGRFILQYRLYEAQDVSLEERIQVLEELKKRDYREKWAYELAYLYHRVGLAARCVEECDELILWFGDGKYVIKAMELKMLHQPLSVDQQAKYDRRFETPARGNAGKKVQEYAAPATSKAVGSDTIPYTPVGRAQEEEELDIQVKTVDVGLYNTMNLQAELAEGLKEVLGSERLPVIEDPITRSIMAPFMETDTETLDYPEIDEVSEEDLEPEAEAVESTEVFFGETGELVALEDAVLEASAQEGIPQAEGREAAVAEVTEPEFEESESAEPEAMRQLDVTAEIVMEQLRLEAVGEDKDDREELLRTEPPRAFAEVLSQESDGQLSLVMPEREILEKQITGQLSIEDILDEWERMKKENQEKREENIRQHVLEHTGRLFTDFDASVRDGLLEQLERQDSEEEYYPEVEEISEEEIFEEEASLEEETFEEGEEFPEEEIFEESEEPSEEENFEETEEVPEEEFIAESEESLEEEILVEEEASAAPEKNSAKAGVRPLTKLEKELYAPYIQSKTAKEQLINVIDTASMAAYTGNIIITGEEGMDTLTLAKNIIRELQVSDSNFSGRVAKISGGALNKKNVEETVDNLKNGALIITKASDMESGTAEALYKSLQQETRGIIIVMEDIRKSMDRFLGDNGKLLESFPARVDVAALSNDALVAFGKKYAYQREYAIDDFGMLALHTRIEERQTLDHAVTILEVQEIVDEAIDHADRKTLGHFFDVLFGKRYDEEDMIVLGEKDFA